MALLKSYTISEMMLKAKPSSKNAGNNLLTEFGIKADVEKLTEEKRLARIAIGHMLAVGRVTLEAADAVSDQANQQISDLAAKTDALLQSVNKQNAELVKSLEFTQKKVESNESETGALRAEIKQLEKSLRKVPSADQENCRVVLISGLVEEEEAGHGLLASVEKFLTEEVDPAARIQVQEVHKMGKPEDGKAKRVKVVLGSRSQAEAVLRAARNLKEFNQERKAAGKRAVGLDQFLSKEEMARKQALWPAWLEARKRRAPKTWWKGACLFVEGQEVQP